MEDFEQISQNIKKNSNNFDFVKTLGEFTINEKFKQGLTELNSGYQSSNTYIWEILSAMNTDISETIYENVLNYIDNISNVDTCKITALQSMLNELGIEYSIFQTYNEFPLGLQNIIDILSINKRYLLKDGFLKDKITQELKEICEKNNGILTNENLYDYIYEIYNNFLKSVINLKYNDKKNSINDEEYVWYGLKDILLNNTKDIKISKFLDFKKKHNISNSFNEEKIVDLINSGEDFIDNYVGCERELLEKEISFRTEPISVNRPQTRYYFYKEKLVKEYFDFIEYKITSIHNLNKISQAKYDIDQNYILIQDFTENYSNHLLEVKNGKYYINETMISDVAKTLTDITLQITNIREKIKLETQKNYMKGTYNLLKYVINEYLISFANSKIFSDTTDSLLLKIKNNLKNYTIDNINQIEYYDTTEYYNIDTGNYKSNSLNEKYWEESERKSNHSFSTEELSNFYCNTLNCKDKINNIENFLCSLYDYGASKIHIENDSIIYNNENNKFDEYNILLTYGGQEISYYPYFNHKNIVHPSFQIHPYLKNFITYAGYEYPIENAFHNNINQQLEDVVVSNIIGNYGQVLNVALNNEYDFSGYKTKYERSSHLINGQKCKIIDYEGAFYPQALTDFINNRNNFINSIRTKSISNSGDTFYEKYYSHLGLTKEEAENIANQLDTNYNQIFNMFSNKSKKEDVYDIYKYATDKYDNVYILYKKYNSAEPSFKEKQNTTGQLWIRLKDHPIAFPAFYGANPNIDTSEKNINGNITLLSKDDVLNQHSLISDSNQMSYFYDFEFDSKKQSIFLVSYPQNNEIDHNIEELKNTFYKKYEFADVIICNIDQTFDIIDNRPKLKFLSDSKQHLTFINSANIVPADKISWGYFNTKTVNCLLGIYQNNFQLNAIYISKTIINNDEGFSYKFDNDHELSFVFFEYNYRESKKEINNVLLQTNIDIDNYTIENTDIKFNYNDGVYTFALMVSKNEDDLSYQTYIGLDEKHDQVTDLELSCESGCKNSFDHLNNYIYIIESFFNTFNFITKSSKLYNLNVDASYIPQFSGEKGFQDFTKNKHTRNKNYYSIQLQGQSSKLLNTIADSIKNTNIFSLDNLEKINEYICGRIYEDYDDKQHLFNSFIIKKMPWKGYIQGDDINLWEIPVNDDNVNLDSFYFVIGNKFTESKKLYFAGSIQEISSDNLGDIYNSGFISLSEKYHSYDEQNIIGELEDSQNANITMAGTYNIFNEITNKTNTNHLYGIKDILIKFEGVTKKLMIKFIIDPSYKQWIIRDNEFYVAAFNPQELRMFEWYHLMEPININQKTLEYVELSSYSHLSDIWQLNGSDSLAFKNSEQDIFDQSDIRYYFPGCNTKYPIRSCDIFDAMKDTIDMADFRNKYVSQSNTYILRLDDMQKLNTLSVISMPYQLFDDEIILVYENYLDVDKDGYKNNYKYDTSSIKMMEFANITETPYIGDCNDYVDLQQSTTYLSSLQNDILTEYDTEIIFAESQNGIFNSSSIKYDLVLSNFSGYEKFNNIYVQYEYDGDQIVLYFNYMNYYNSPFVSIKDNKQKNDTINGTYLVLKPNEDGILDIIIQIKNYLDDRTLLGFVDIKIASYRIFNISDDKPKFLIQKITDDVKVMTNSVVDNLKSNIFIDSKTIEIDGSKTNENIEFKLRCSTTSMCDITSYKYSFTYPHDDLLVIIPSYLSDKVTSNGGVITVNTDENIELTFKTKNKISYFNENEIQPRFIFNIIDSEAYSNNHQSVECYYNNSIIECEYKLLLRLESDNSEHLILLENGEGIEIKENKGK